MGNPWCCGSLRVLARGPVRRRRKRRPARVRRLRDLQPVAFFRGEPFLKESPDPLRIGMVRAQQAPPDPVSPRDHREGKRPARALLDPEQPEIPIAPRRIRMDDPVNLFSNA